MGASAAVLGAGPDLRAFPWVRLTQTAINTLMTGKRVNKRIVVGASLVSLAVCHADAAAAENQVNGQLGEGERAVVDLVNRSLSTEFSTSGIPLQAYFMKLLPGAKCRALDDLSLNALRSGVNVCVGKFGSIPYKAIFSLAVSSDELWQNVIGYGIRFELRDPSKLALRAIYSHLPTSRQSLNEHGTEPYRANCSTSEWMATQRGATVTLDMASQVVSKRCTGRLSSFTLSFR